MLWLCPVTAQLGHPTTDRIHPLAREAVMSEHCLWFCIFETANYDLNKAIRCNCCSSIGWANIPNIPYKWKEKGVLIQHQICMGISMVLHHSTCVLDRLAQAKISAFHHSHASNLPKTLQFNSHSLNTYMRMMTSRKWWQRIKTSLHLRELAEN